MSSLVWTFEEATAIRRANAHKSFARYGSDGNPVDDPTTARDRLLSGNPVIVQNVPRFKLNPGATIYTIGSCFARNVEVLLQSRGFIVPALEVEFDQSIYHQKPRFPHTILNKYNAHSAAREIERALGLFAPPDDGLIELVEGSWFDPQMSYTAGHPRDLVVKEREKLNRLCTRLLESDVLVITLGLTETWRDGETGYIFNNSIASVAGSRTWRKRLEMFNARVHDVYNSLMVPLCALHKARPELKIILTVSPVPIAQTFTHNDIVTANTRSKAVLRAAADMLYEDLPFLDYFPSYEMVISSPRGMTWANDQIHVSNKVVVPVINEFVTRYVDAPDA